MSRKKQVRFSANDVIKLLKEVLADNPFEDKSKWSGIGRRISVDNFNIEPRRARERTLLLLNQFRKEEREAMSRY